MSEECREKTNIEDGKSVAGQGEQQTSESQNTTLIFSEIVKWRAEQRNIWVDETSTFRGLTKIIRHLVLRTSTLTTVKMEVEPGLEYIIRCQGKLYSTEHVPNTSVRTVKATYSTYDGVVEVLGFKINR
jgi:hypothetical protein